MTERCIPCEIKDAHVKLDRVERAIQTMESACVICSKPKQIPTSQFCNTCRAEMDHEHVQSEVVFMSEYEIFLAAGDVPERYM